jgi:streptogramin lyase
VTLANPAELAVLADGTLLVVEDGLGRLVRVDPAAGSVTQWQTLEDPYGLALAADGVVFATSGNDIVRIDGSGGRTQVARFDTAIGPLELGPDGFLYVATARQQILRVNPATGASSVYAGNGTGGAAGDGGPATSAQLQGVHGMAFGPGGALYLADTGNDRVRRIDATTGVITTVATIRIAVAATAAGDGSVYVTSGGDNRVYRIAPDGSTGVLAGNGRAASTGDGGLATAASLHGPTHLAVDGAGNVYVTEFETGRIRRIDAAGRISTIVRGS